MISEKEAVGCVKNIPTSGSENQTLNASFSCSNTYYLTETFDKNNICQWVWANIFQQYLMISFSPQSKQYFTWRDV